MVTAATRFFSKLFLLRKSNLERHLLHSGTIRKTHVTMASAATAIWLANGSKSRKKRMDNASFQGAEIVRNSDANRKRIQALRTSRVSASSDVLSRTDSLLFVPGINYISYEIA
jgi:hypothetical protein